MSEAKLVVPLPQAVLFGTGYVANLISGFINSNFSLVSVIDNNEKKIGNIFSGHVISHPECILDIYFDYVILASSDLKSMARQLLALGVSADKFVASWEICFSIYTKNTSFRIVFDESSGEPSLYDEKQERFLFTDLVKLEDVGKIRFGVRNIPTVLALFEDNKLSRYFEIHQILGGPNINEGLFCDVGANIGTTSIEALRSGKVKEVFAFEPDPLNAVLLRENIELNNLNERVTLFEVALSDSDGYASIQRSPSCSGDTRVVSDDCAFDGLKIRTRTLDGILNEFSAGPVSCVWIDVQGHELMVLKGALKSIKKWRVTVQLEFWPHGLDLNNSLVEMIEFLSDNFTGYVECLRDDLGNPIDVRPFCDLHQLYNDLKAWSEYAHTDIILVD